MPEPRVPDDDSRPPTALPVEMRDVVWRDRDVRLIDGLSMRLARNLRTVIMGPNGAGKSLTLRLLQGLLQPSAGEIVWAGRKAPLRIHRRVSLVFQRPVLLRRSVAGNLRHALRVSRVPRNLRDKRMHDLLEMGRLTRFAERPARLLSGGEQQRLALVRALAADPEMLLLDEPTVSLDPHSTQAIETLIAAAHESGTKIVLVTHDTGQARRLADEIVFLHRGKATEQTPAAAFFDRPTSEAGQAYLSGRLLI